MVDGVSARLSLQSTSLLGADEEGCVEWLGCVPRSRIYSQLELVRRQSCVSHHHCYFVSTLLAPYAMRRAIADPPRHRSYRHTVACDGRPEGGRLATDPNANQVAQKDVETCAFNWGRFMPTLKYRPG